MMFAWALIASLWAMSLGCPNCGARLRGREWVLGWEHPVPDRTCWKCGFDFSTVASVKDRRK